MACDEGRPAIRHVARHTRVAISLTTRSVFQRHHDLEQITKPVDENGTSPPGSPATRGADAHGPEARAGWVTRRSSHPSPRKRLNMRHHHISPHIECTPTMPSVKQKRASPLPAVTACTIDHSLHYHLIFTSTSNNKMQQKQNNSTSPERKTECRRVEAALYSQQRQALLADDASRHRSSSTAMTSRPAPAPQPPRLPPID